MHLADNQQQNIIKTPLVDCIFILLEDNRVSATISVRLPT